MALASPVDASLSVLPSSSEDRSRLLVVVDVMSVVSRPNTEIKWDSYFGAQDFRKIRSYFTYGNLHIQLSRS